MRRMGPGRVAQFPRLGYKPSANERSRMSGIRIEGLTKTYRAGRVRALDGVSLEIGAGEAFGIIGPNGAGKTTLVGCLLGHLRPDTGRIELDRRAQRQAGDRLPARAPGARSLDERPRLPRVPPRARRARSRHPQQRRRLRSRARGTRGRGRLAADPALLARHAAAAGTRAGAARPAALPVPRRTDLG